MEKEKEIHPKRCSIACWKLYLFPVRVGDNDEFTSPSSFLGNEEVSRDRGQESTFIPKRQKNIRTG